MSWLHRMLCDPMVEVIRIPAFISNSPPPPRGGQTVSLCSSGWPQAQIPVLALKACTIWPSNYCFWGSLMLLLLRCVSPLLASNFLNWISSCVRDLWSWEGIDSADDLEAGSQLCYCLFHSGWRVHFCRVSGKSIFGVRLISTVLLCFFILTQSKDNTEDLGVRKWKGLFFFLLGAFSSCS